MNGESFLRTVHMIAATATGAQNPMPATLIDGSATSSHAINAPRWIHIEYVRSDCSASGS